MVDTGVLGSPLKPAHSTLSHDALALRPSGEIARAAHAVMTH